MWVSNNGSERVDWTFDGQVWVVTSRVAILPHILTGKSWTITLPPATWTPWFKKEQESEYKYWDDQEREHWAKEMKEQDFDTHYKKQRENLIAESKFGNGPQLLARPGKRG